MLLFFVLVCWAVAAEGNGKSVESVEIAIEEMPYQGSVEVQGTHVCSAAILSPKYIIMTAVCAEEFRVDVVIATFRFGTTTRLYDGDIHRCSKMQQHPKYDIYNNTYDQKDYDIAVAEVYPDIRINGETIRSISLPDKQPAVGSTARLSGWGSLRENGAIMVYARARNILITDVSDCRTALQDVFPVSDRMFCADGVVCDGDEGSLLTTGDSLLGMFSWGRGCGSQGIPDVYVNLANPEVRDFIRNVTSL